LIIAAIAIPNLLRARIAANEASAVSSVRSVVTAEVTYSSTWRKGYAVALANLGGAVPCAASAATACLIDPVLAGGTKRGYKIAALGRAAVGGIVQTFAVSATPVTVGQTGQRAFCSDEFGIVRVAETVCHVFGAAGPPSVLRLPLAALRLSFSRGVILPHFH
jgi:type IV pilus assembly protein PilA